jgi:hypothetical protein
MKNHFYHHNIWKHLSAFADLFSDMQVFVYNKERTKATGLKNVPLLIAPKEKVVSTLIVNGQDKPQSDNQLPKMSVFWNSFDPDPDRNRGTKMERKLLIETLVNDNGNTIKREVYKDLQTIPYKMGIDLTIWTKYMDEAAQLLENILPFFTPDLPLSLFERAVGIERKVMAKLISVSSNLVGDLNEPDRRVIQYTLSFTLECNLYRPLEIEGEIQKVGVRIANADEPHSFSGDVLYSTVLGISGQIMDAGVRECILSFDSLKDTADDPNTPEDETRTPLDHEVEIRAIRVDELDYYNDVLIPSLTPGTSAYIIAVAKRDLLQLTIDTDTNTTTAIELSGQGLLVPYYNSDTQLAHDYYNMMNSLNPNPDSR